MSNQQFIIAKEEEDNIKYHSIQLYNNFTIDFNKLALLQPSLHSSVLILNYRVVWNFSDQSNLIKLTKAILKHIFQLQWECPAANLCPRIPSRVNYLMWISLQAKQGNGKVLDVGTGATLIYPLIGYRLFNWDFIGIELNENSYLSSKKIIEANNLQKKIDLRLSIENDEESILSPVIKLDEIIWMVVCNPPFFQIDCPTLSTMTQSQHHTSGGEYQFFFNLYRDSFKYKNIKYFSCLIGLLSNFRQIKKLMINEDKYGFLTELKLGQINQGKNKRYIILWKIKHF